MNEFLTNILLKVLFIVAILTYAIHWGALLPTIRKHREVALGEWLFPGSGYNIFSYLEEYKLICLRNDIPLTWYRVQWGLFIFLFTIVLICFVNVVLM